jgi:hypothetical protein
MYSEYKVSIPSGTSGKWSVSPLIVSHENSIRDHLFSKDGRYTPEGTYTVLKCGSEIIMSDTPDEIRDHLHFIRQAQGDILINGLGLGMVAKACLSKPSVTSVTVIELSPDVISLVAPHIADPRLTIIQADAFTYKPTRHYDSVWHDIWSYICTDNLPEMTKLHRKYGKFTNYQDSWSRSECLRHRREEKRDESRFRLFH